MRSASHVRVPLGLACDDVDVGFRGVIFDIGGVLEINPRTGWQQLWAERLGVGLEELLRRAGPIWSQGDVGALTLDQIERQTARELALDNTQLAALMADLWTEYLGTLNAELAHYFTALRPRYRTAILSNSFAGAREREHALYGFEDLCDAVVYSHEEGIKKPQLRVYEIACERIGVHPSEAIFLDDVEACVQGARRAGLTAIRFHSNEQAVGELERLLGQS